MCRRPAPGEGPKLGVYGAGGYGETGSGGGGGDCYKAGGGGGGNIGGGGRGGVAIDTGLSVGGLGGRGLSFSPSFSRLTFGGGGGSAHADNIGGTPGGGIVFVRAASIVGGGAIRADAPPANNLPTPTGSGGGAGGTVSLRTTGTADCGVVSAAGAAGGVGGPGTLGSPGSPGGGGGGGRVVVQSSSGSCIANSTSVQGGAAVGTSGSTAGSGGLFEQRGVGYPVLPAPTIDSPADGSLINTVQPFLTGHLNGGAPADTQVAIYLSGSELMRVPVGPSGNWSTRLNIGSASHQVSARAHSLGDADVFSPAAIVQFTLDYFPPTPPVITSPGDGSLLTTATPQISGATEANAAFEVFLDGVLASTGFASGGGLFSYTTGVLSQTTHSVYATAKDLAGNKSTGATVTFTVDTIAPLAPAVTAPSAGVEIADSTPVFAGTAEPNATVSVYIDTVLQGTATAGASGDWVFTQPTPLGSTSHTLNATTTDAAGNVSGLSGTVAFSIAPVPPAPATPIVLHPSAHESFASVALTVSGTAGANLHVFIKIDDVAATDLFADVNGNWSILLPADLTEGEHTISVSAEDLYAQTSAFSSPRTFTVDLTPPERPVIIAPLVNGFVNTTSPTFAGTAEANCSVEINVDALPVGVAAVSGDGSWSDTVILGAIMNLNGTHSVNARTFDAAGNYSAAAVIAFTIDTIPPDTIAMGVPTGPITATNLSIALSSNEMSVNFECNLDNAGFVPCAATWVLTGLGVGTHTVIVRAVDQAGNVDPTPLTGTFVVDASGVVVVGPTGTTGAGGGSGATGGTSGTPNSGGTSGDSNTDGAMSDAGDANMTPGTTEQSPKKQGCSASTPANRSFMVLLMALIAARTLARRRRT